MTDFIHIDGSFGEGGGQVLRTALSLSVVTGKPFRIDNIRAGRKNPGLMRQHLTAVAAAAEISAAETSGADIRSRALSFAPQGIWPGSRRFAVGTAGSATLVLQTVLPALMAADEPSHLVLEGGTHNPFAPPFDFIDRVFLPIINRLGPKVTAGLERPGFYPAGGGRFTVKIEPASSWTPIDLVEMGEITTRAARALVSRLPRKIAERELAVAEKELGWPREFSRIEEVERTLGPGNALFLEIGTDKTAEIVTGFGMKGVSAEVVAKKAAREMKEFLAAGVPVGIHLADQLLIPLALAGGGRFRTLALSRHAQTNIEVLKKFLDVEVTVSNVGGPVWEVAVE